MRNFDTGATRDTDEGKISYRGFLSPFALEEFGRYMNSHRVQADGSLRDPDNWKKGIPIPVYEDSLLRHAHEFHKFTELGDLNKSIEVACALMFNIQGWLHEVVKYNYITATEPVADLDIEADMANIVMQHTGINHPDVETAQDRAPYSSTPSWQRGL